MRLNEFFWAPNLLLLFLRRVDVVIGEPHVLPSFSRTKNTNQSAKIENNKNIRPPLVIASRSPNRVLVVGGRPTWITCRATVQDSSLVSSGGCLFLSGWVDILQSCTVYALLAGCTTPAKDPIVVSCARVVSPRREIIYYAKCFQ